MIQINKNRYCRLVYELLPLNVNIYKGNGSKIQFSPITSLLRARLQYKHMQDILFDAPFTSVNLTDLKRLHHT